MKEPNTEVSLRFLIIQAVATVALVAALLLGLRLNGVIIAEDVPPEAVEAQAE